MCSENWAIGMVCLRGIDACARAHGGHRLANGFVVHLTVLGAFALQVSAIGVARLGQQLFGASGVVFGGALRLQGQHLIGTCPAQLVGLRAWPAHGKTAKAMIFTQNVDTRSIDIAPSFVFMKIATYAIGKLRAIADNRR
nr:hypothetical protein [Comamonas koreensis]